MRIAFIHSAMRFESYAGTYLYQQLLRGIADGCVEHGLLFDIYDGKLSIARMAASPARFAYAGFIGLVPLFDTRQRGAWERLSRSMPCVDVMTGRVDGGGLFVGNDEVHALSLLVDHFVSRGIRRIGYFGLDNERFSFERHAAFHSAMKRHGISPASSWVHAPGSVYRRRAEVSGYEEWMRGQAGEYYSNAGGVEAVIAEKDHYALALCDIVASKGMRVPEDIAVAGIDNNRTLFQGYINGFLTTVEQDVHGIGLAAVRLLVDAIEGGKDRAAVTVKPRLLVRRSSLIDWASKNNDDVFRRTVRAYLGVNYGEGDIIRSLASMTGTSPRYFLQKFKALFGTPFIKHLNHIRITAAAKALTGTRHSITRIAIECGFNSHQNFTRAFTREFGVSAAAYRTRKI